MDDAILVEGSAANDEAITEAVSNFEIMTAFISRVFSFFLCGFLQQTMYLFLVCILVVLKNLVISILSVICNVRPNSLSDLKRKLRLLQYRPKYKHLNICINVCTSLVAKFRYCEKSTNFF